MGHIQIRISDEEKKAAEKVLKKMGLNYSMAIKLFLRHVVKTKQLPFQIGVFGGSVSIKNNDTSNNLREDSVDLPINDLNYKKNEAKSRIPDIKPDTSSSVELESTNDLSRTGNLEDNKSSNIPKIQPKKTWSPFQKHRIG